MKKRGMLRKTRCKIAVSTTGLCYVSVAKAEELRATFRRKGKREIHNIGRTALMNLLR